MFAKFGEIYLRYSSMTRLIFLYLCSRNNWRIEFSIKRDSNRILLDFAGLEKNFFVHEEEDIINGFRFAGKVS